MQNYVLSHVRDAVLLRDLAELVSRDRATTATLLAHIAEVDARRLYVPAGYSSMHAYCVDELRLSEDAAKRRIQAARAARQFPAIFHAIAEGRVHLTGVCLIVPHLTAENARGLIEAASHKRKFEIEEFLARHFQLPEASVRPITPIHPEIRQSESGGLPASSEGALAHLPDLQSTLPPAVPERYLLQVIIAKSTQDKLRHLRDLLSHAVPNGDVAQVLDRAFDALIAQIEKRKIGATTGRPRRQRTPMGKRCVSAEVRRAVWDRDRGRCTFVGARGRRCKARKFLEFDHVDPVARGGAATVERMRLRCRTHNQYEAERAFGTAFMTHKRREARVASAEARGKSAQEEQTQDVVAGLRTLGCGAHEARRAAEFSRGTTLEERVRAALKFVSRR